MSVKAAGVAFFIFVLFLPLFSCGELDTVFPSNGGYQVKILVNGNSLEDCSFVRTDDRIRPYFAASVTNDPDLTGLLVYLRDSRGYLAGEKVKYILNPFLDEGEENDVPPDSAVSEEDGDAPSGEEEESGLPEPPRARWSFSDTNYSEDNTGVTIVEVKSFDRDLPFFPIPENLEIGTYSLVFEALGGKNILSRTETEIFYLGDTEFDLKDISVHLPGVSYSQLIPPGATVMLEARLDFNDKLKPYVVWYNGKNVIGEGGLSDEAGKILWKTPDQAGFYSLRLEVFPFRLKRNFAGISREIVLPVSPKAGNIGYFFEDSEFALRSPLAQGTAFPEQIAAAVAKDTAEEDAAEDAFISDISFSPPSVPEPPELLHLYQFGGSLSDSTAVLAPEKDLLPITEMYPKWAAVDQSFGLSTGSDDIYFLPPLNFFRKDGDQGGGIFLLHLKPLAEGVIFSAFFPSPVSPETGVTMELSRMGNVIVLRLNAAGEKDVVLPVYAYSYNLRSYVPVVIEFFFRPYRLEAKLTLGEPPFNQSVVKSIRLLDPIAGEGRVWLGGIPDVSGNEKKPAAITMEEIYFDPFDLLQNEIPADTPVREDSLEAEETEAAPAVVTKEPEPANETNDLSITAIWNEFSVLYSSMPLLPEEITVTELPEDEVISIDNAEGGQAPAETKIVPHSEETPAAENDVPSPHSGDIVPLEEEIQPEAINAVLQEDIPGDMDETETEDYSEYPVEDLPENSVEDLEEPAVVSSIRP